MFTMWPRPRCFIFGTTSLHPVMTPMTLMSIWRRVVASSSSSNGPSGMIPALLTSTSTGPSVRSTSSRKRANEARSHTLSSKASTLPPSSEAALRASSASRSPMPTRTPWRASARAVALPMPRAAPVMATTWP
jgi:hypothetical protein